MTEPTSTTRSGLAHGFVRKPARSRRHLWATTGIFALGIGLVVQVLGVGSIQPASAAAGCTIAAAGDIAESGGAQAKTAAIVTSLNPTAVLTLGDNAYPNGSSSDYAKYYDPSWGKFKSITKPAPGNHEYYTPNGADYLKYFNVPPYYAYNLCGWRMYSLNREISGAQRTAELAWLKVDLAAHAGQPKLAVWHEPRWTSGTKHGSDKGAQDLWAAVVAGGVKVVLSGHEHSYERLGPMDVNGKPAANGTREFIVGEGGNPGLSTFGTPLAASEKRIQGQQGVLSMTLRTTGYDFALHQVGGAVADAGTISFGGPTSVPTTTATPQPSPTTTTVRPTPTPTPTRTPTPVPKPTPSPARASQSVKAVEDASVVQGSASKTGGDASLVVGNVAGLKRRAYIKFVVAGIPSGATNIRASLKVTAASAGSFSTTVHRAASNSWSESALTWANQVGEKGPKIAGIAPLAVGASRAVNVSSAVAGNGTYSFVLSSNKANAITRFASSESATPPALKLSWTPRVQAAGAGAASAPAASAPAPSTASPAAPSPVTTAPAVGAMRSGATGRAWAAPALTNPTTIQLSNRNHDLKLNRTKDYRLVMPKSVLDVGTAQLTINGGHNVVLIGGQMTSHGARGSIRATNQTGTLHIEGLYVSGSNLQEGLQFQNEGSAIVQLVNIRIDLVHGGTNGHHADLVQTYGGGPKTLRIDGLTASTQYQAFMLADARSVTGWDFRHINITHSGSGGWTMYDSAPTAASIAMTGVYLKGNDANGVYSLGHHRLKPGLSWGSPASGDFVRAGTVGLTYGGR
jgi:hypothetical protein